MKIIKTLFSIFFILFYSSAISQSDSLSNDQIVLQLNIVTFESEKIVTTVHLRNTADNKTRSFKTDNKGKISCNVQIGGNYVISITDSDDSYEYTIPDSDGVPLIFNFKYNLQQKSISTVVIKIFNNEILKDILVDAKNDSRQILRIKNDTVHFLISKGRNYLVQAAGVEIKNNFIKFDGTYNSAFSYVLYFSDEKHAELIAIDSSQSVLNIVYKNLYNKPVKGEVITIEGKKHGTNYKIRTSTNGSSLAILPANDYYTVSLKYFPNVFNINIEKENSIILANNLLLNYPSPLEFEKQKKEEAKRIAKRDSLYKIYDKPFELNYLDLQNDLSAQASIDAVEIEKDLNYFKKKNNVVCAVLNRNKWASKIIVTDVTGSMYPYMKEVALWHLLEMMNKSRSDYVFFNDGDNKQDYLKVIGKTGGVYTSLKGAPDSVIKTMHRAMNNGNGGDTPENDIEALLTATKLKEPNSELLLVADNLSGIKDISLINEVKLPVRVILCGAQKTWIHSDYLELAYKTGGSIHTIEEDLFTLSKLHNGETIVIGGISYKFEGGRFFLITSRL
ncbi:hypothetical protein [Ferruginibacter sp.]